MNEILNRIDDFLAEKEKKEKFMIYGAIIIVFILIYYYFNYKTLHSKIEEEHSSLITIQKNYDINAYKKKLTQKRNEYFNLVKQINSVKSNLQEVNKLISTTKTPQLIVKKDELFKYLKDVFKFSISKYVFPSYEINESKKDLRLYKVSFQGEVNMNNFKNFISFLRYMEHNHFIAYFKSLEFNVSRYKGGQVSDFNGTFNIWSYK